MFHLAPLIVIPAKAGIHDNIELPFYLVFVNYYVYILASKYNGTLYIGVTNNLERRVFEHKSEVNEGFTKKYGVKRLVYFERFTNISEAIRREKNMKKWKRQWKIDLIEKDNPKWDDLSRDWMLNSEI